MLVGGILYMLRFMPAPDTHWAVKLDVGLAWCVARPFIDMLRICPAPPPSPGAPAGTVQVCLQMATLQVAALRPHCAGAPCQRTHAYCQCSHVRCRRIHVYTVDALRSAD